MILTVDIQSASVEPVPEEDDIRGWLAAALDGRCPQARCEVSVRLVDREEMTTLNTTYRGKTGATNVLSFPADLPAVSNDDLPGDGLLGDIVICAPVVREEAADQGKSTQAHWAHMTVHGALHLLGYDHIDDQDAEVMEALETAILSQLEYPCPYHETLEGEHTKP